jgi:hypothetical protein
MLPNADFDVFLGVIRELEPEISILDDQQIISTNISKIYTHYKKLKKSQLLNEKEVRDVLLITRQLDLNSKEFFSNIVSKQIISNEQKGKLYTAIHYLILLIFLRSGDLRILNSLYKICSFPSSIMLEYIDIKKFSRLLNCIVNKYLKIENA